MKWLSALALFVFGIAVGAGIGHDAAVKKSFDEGKAAGVREGRDGLQRELVDQGHGVWIENRHTGEREFFWKGTEPTADQLERGGSKRP